jgi:hypothetical protein
MREADRVVEARCLQLATRATSPRTQGEHRPNIFVLFRNIAAHEYACDTLQARALLDNSKELARLRAHEFGRFGE